MGPSGAGGALGRLAGARHARVVGAGAEVDLDQLGGASRGRGGQLGGDRGVGAEGPVAGAAAVSAAASATSAAHSAIASGGSAAAARAVGAASASSARATSA